MKYILTLFCSFFLGFSFSQIPSDNLVLHLPLNGSANDISGNDLDGDIYGAEPTTNRFGEINSAIAFNGTSDYISIPENALMDLEFPFTASLWFYKESIPTTTETLFKSDANDFAYSGFWISMAPTGQIAAGYGNGVGIGINHRVSKRSISVPAPGEWHQILAVFNDLNDIDLYIDCELDPGSYSGTGSVMSYLGESSTIGKYDFRVFDGKLDDIRIYSDAIQPAEVMNFCKKQYTEIDVANSTKIGVDIYPNPTFGELDIKIKSTDLEFQKFNLAIINAKGEIIMEQPIESNQMTINLTKLKLSSGTYLLRFTSKDHETIFSKKIIFQE